uniref:Uncharacterized protein n=1 Tax=mine drainage metagenome TaxID=410659 RepID=E6QWP3_9ZZZZ
MINEFEEDGAYTPIDSSNLEKKITSYSPSKNTGADHDNPPPPPINGNDPSNNREEAHEMSEEQRPPLQSFIAPRFSSEIHQKPSIPT